MKLYNTLTKSTQEFVPLHDKHVSLYTCGPTVYGELHVGNWLAYLRWDILVRALRDAGYNVERVMNITDVGHLTGENEGNADRGEDKLQKGARRDGVTVWDVAERYTNLFMDGMDQLGLIRPEHITKATDYIAEQIALIEVLEEKEFTYSTSDGIYFDTARFPSYASFAGLDLKGQQAGARVEFNDEKRNPSDFALWKFSPEHETRGMEWESPWGVGFPGWHLECSAMAMHFFGPTLDIHTGGIDHIPVHHTNEIAQSEAATGKQFSRFWLHANFLTADGTKISKSIGNVFVLKDLYDKGFSANDFRMFTLQSHYRTETNFTWDNISAAAQRLKRWQSAAKLRHQTHDTLVDDSEKDTDSVTVGLYEKLHTAQLSLHDDLNTPEVLRNIEEAFDLIEKQDIKDVHQESLRKLLDWIDQALGLGLIESTPDISDEAKQLLLERTRSREEKDWKRSDELRDQLATLGVSVRDTASGCIWY